MTEADDYQDEGAEGEAADADEVTPAEHLDEQLGGGDESGVEEALQAWAEGGHAGQELEDTDEVQLVHLPQLEPGIPQPTHRQGRLNNVEVTVSVELGRVHKTVREISELNVTDVIELDKLAGESFEIRVNGRIFAWGEVVVVTDVMAVRITGLVNAQPGEEGEGPP